MLKQLRYFFTLMLLAVASVGFADEVTDVITADDLTATGTSYTDFSGVSKNSGAVYAGQSAKNSAGAIQLRSKNSNSGIVTTTSGGKVKSVTITVESGSNTIDVYGKNTPYTSAANLYATGEGDQGTKLGSLTETGTITIDGDYEYIGIRSYNGAIYLSEVEIVWETDGETPPTPTKIDIAKLNGISPTTLNVEDEGTFTLDATFAEGTVADDDYEVTWESDNTDVLDVENGDYLAYAAGTANITVTVTALDDELYNDVSKTFAVKVVDPNASGTENNPYTVAEALEVIDGLANNGYSDFVYVKGIISSIKSIDVSKYERAQYYISADGSTNDELYVYNGYYLNNVAFTANDQIQVGDQVVIYGKLQKYVKNNVVTPEIAQDNYIVSIVNSGKPSAELAFEPTELTVELGDDFTEPTLNNPYNVAVTYASSDENVAEVDADGSLTINGAGTATITATFAGNDNYAAGEASYTLTVVDPDAPGASIDNPYTVEEAIAFIETLGTNTSGDVYVKGIISQIDEVSTEHGNATYWISDDGGTDVQMEVYRGKYLDGANFENEGQIAVGDEVIVFGKVKNYNGTPEFTQGNYIVELKHTDTPVLEDAGLAYDVEAFTATIGEENEFPVLANPNELEVTYTSSNEEVATIDAEGNITLLAAGETTITATSEATDAFKAGEASYVLTVEEKIEPGEGVQYQLVTSTNDITSGKYLIVSTKQDGSSVAFDGSLETLDAVGNTQDVTIANNVITTDKGIYFNIDVENGTVQSASGQYIGVSSNSNGLKQTEVAETYTHTFALDDNGYAVVSAVFEGSTMSLRFNYAKDQLRFRYYKSGQQPIYLFKAVEEVEGETIPVTISSAEWATLYYSDKAFEIPEGVTANIVTAVDNKKLELEALNGIIPAGTAVALNGPQGTYNFKVVNDETVAPANNLLRGFDASHLTEGGDIYYKLTVKNDIVGFYWGEENGEAFESGAHKAYLAIPAGASNAKFFVLGTAGDLVSEDGGFVDGINEVTASDSKKEYFNLNGTRVNSLRKGIYIVGGKKVVIK